MQALLNDIELDIQELKYLIEAISAKSDSALRNVARRNILQMRNRLDVLLGLLEEEQTGIEITQPIEVSQPVKENMTEPLIEPVREVAEAKTSLAIAPILAERIKPATDLKHSISLNDSFRFSRELFGGDMELMNRLLQQMGEMVSLDAALVLLSSKIQPDEESEAMNDFMELLKKYFN